jgi:hypothetical protein
MENTKNKSTRSCETKNNQTTHDIRLRNTQNRCPKMMNHRVVVYREKTANFKAKPLRVISIRVSDEDAEFLKSLPNASEFLRKAIDEEKRRQAKLESKGLPLEIVSEIAQAYTNHEIQLLQDDKWDLEWHSERLSDSLFDISQLTLDCPDPYSLNKESIVLPESMYLDEICEGLQSKEAKAFIQKIRDKVIQHHNDKTINISLDADELETIRKIYDEAKIMLAEAYRKTFHKLPPDDWHLTIIDGRQYRDHDRLRYKLP